MRLDKPDATLRLLGDVGIWVGGADALPRSRKARALLGIIAVSPAYSRSREQLAELLWSDRAEEQARSSLRQVLTELKTGLLATGCLLWISRDSVGLEAGRVDTDIAAIVDACDRNDIPRLAECMADIGGIFMAGYDGLSPGYDDWLRVERPRHHDLIVSAVLDKAPIMVSAARATNMQAILRGLDKLDPYNEVAARLGMELDHAAGDGASLHRRYRRLSEQLEKEFGSQPAPETRALFHRLTAQPTTIPPMVPSPSVPAMDVVRAPATPARTPPMVMVSAIVANADDHDAAEIAAAATDDIRVALARHADVRVIALDSLDMERIESVCSGALATYMLSGRVRRSESGSRVNLQLGNVGSSIIVWSEQLHIDRGSIDDAVNRIVAKAVGAVVPAIDRDFSARTRFQQTELQDAAALYARGRYLIRSVRTLIALRDGMSMLERVILLDPGHVGARLLLAQLYNTDLWQQIAGHDVTAFRARALALLQQAAGIEPENTRIQIKLAWCYLRRHDWPAAERRLHNALDASPYDAEAIDECALGFAQLGDLDLAEQLMQRAFTLNPFPPPDYHADYAILLAMRGNGIASEEHFEASGETRLQYLAARLANLSRLSGLDDKRLTLRANFLERFATAWEPDRPFQDSDLIEWLEQTYVFKLREHSAFWREGFMAALR